MQHLLTVCRLCLEIMQLCCRRFKDEYEHLTDVDGMGDPIINLNCPSEESSEESSSKEEEPRMSSDELSDEF